MRPPATGRGWLARLGLHDPILRAWALYDLGNAALSAVVITAIYPVYFQTVASAGLPPAAATLRFSIATTVALAIAALLSPLIGTLADHGMGKKRLLAGAVGLGASVTAALAFVGPGMWRSGAVLFALVNIGAAVAFVLYDALLPSLVQGPALDRLSTASYAIGYLGSGGLLAVDLVLLQRPTWFGLSAHGDPTVPARLAFVLVAVFWVVVTLPLLRRVPEPPALPRPVGTRGVGVVLALVRDLRATARDLRQYRHAALFLVAFLIYNDGIGTIIRMAGIFGKEVGLPTSALVGSIVLVQFVGVPCGFLFGALAHRIGAKRAIYTGLVVYTGISVLGYTMTTVWHFLALAVLVGMVQGGTQALSRSLFASLIPPSKAGAFFGFFAVGEKFAGVLGPAVFAVTIAVTGSSRGAILSVMGFFAIGGWLLTRVDVPAGQRQAAEAEAALRAVCPPVCPTA